MNSRRTDEQGRAYAGSQLQTQIYVSRRQIELSNAVLASLREIGGEYSLVRWVAPVQAKQFREPRDREFLKVVELECLGASLEAFWPTGGPRWDALALLQPGDAVLLVEAKSYPAEMLGGGCKASKPAYSRIQRSLDTAKRHFGVDISIDWMGDMYQYANRLAHVHFLRNMCGHPAYLANLCFVNDPRRLTALDEWQSELKTLKRHLGFESNIPFSVDVFLPARQREELLELG